MATRLVAYKSARIPKISRLSQHYHASARREVGPIILGLGVFVAANAAAYALRTMERKSHNNPKGPSSDNEEDTATGSYLYKRNNSLASSTGRPHPLYSASNTSLGVDLGSSSMRIAALLARSSLDPSEASTPLAKRAEVLESRTGHRATPAFVNVGSSEAIAGEVARSRRFSHSSTTVWNLQQLVEDAYAGRLPEAKASSFTAWNEVVKVDEDVAQDSGSSDDCANSSTANAQKNAFSLDHVILAPPGVHDRNFYASNGLPPLRASGVHGVLWQDLLSGASGRLGGGQGGADLMNSATLVVSLPRSLPEPVRGAYLLAAMRDVHKAAQQNYNPITSLKSTSSHTKEDEEKGAVVVGCIDDAAAALLSSLADGTLPPEAAGSSMLLVVDIGAMITQATVFKVLPMESSSFGQGSVGNDDAFGTFPPPPEVLGASASRGVGFRAVVGAVVNHVADRFAEAHGVDLRQDYLAHERLETAVEEATHTLSKQATQTSLNLPFVAMDTKITQPLHLNDSLGRAQLAHVAKDPLSAIAEIAAQALTDTGWNSSCSSSDGGHTNESNKITLLLVGGGARSGAVVDAVRSRVAAMMPKSTGQKGSPSDVLVVLPEAPEEAVVLGAALAAKAGWVF